MRPIIGSGAVLANAPHPGMAALLLLDAIQPVGVTEVWLDPAGLIPALGALGYLKPEAVVQMLDIGELLRVGSVICVDGRVRRIGQGGLRVTIQLEDGTVEKKRVAAGTLWTYPLPPGETALVEVSVSRGLNIHGNNRIKLRLEGGVAGLIFDARGRPLPLPRDADARAQLYPRWVAGTRGAVRRRMDEQDESQISQDEIGRVEIVSEAEEAPVAEPALDEGIELADAQEKGARRGLFGWLRRERRTEIADNGEDALEERLDVLAGEILAESESEAAPEVVDEEQGRKRRGLFRR